MEQVADIDVLPESDRMMSDRMRQGRERLLWADDAMVAMAIAAITVRARIYETPVFYLSGKFYLSGT